MKRLDGNYKHTMLTNLIKAEIRKDFIDNIYNEILNSVKDENKIIFEKWLNQLHVEDLIILKLYMVTFDTQKISMIIDKYIDEYAEEW